MSRIGMIEDITVDGSISIVTIQDTDMDKPILIKAKSRMFLSAIDECYGEKWKGKTIEYDIDSIGCMIAFQPADLDFDDTP